MNFGWNPLCSINISFDCCLPKSCYLPALDENVENPTPFGSVAEAEVSSCETFYFGDATVHGNQVKTGILRRDRKSRCPYRWIPLERTSECENGGSNPVRATFLFVRKSETARGESNLPTFRVFVFFSLSLFYFFSLLNKQNNGEAESGGWEIC